MASGNQQAEAAIGELQALQSRDKVEHVQRASTVRATCTLSKRPLTDCLLAGCQGLPAMSVQKAELRWPEANVLKLRIIETLGLPVSRLQEAPRRW
jgi:hypothetical protein